MVLKTSSLCPKPCPPCGRGQALVVHAAEDYYTTLGVDKGADKKTIKSAYRQKARKFHPDVNKAADAEDKFKAISNAYEVLSDDQKRGIYDRRVPSKAWGFRIDGFSVSWFVRLLLNDPTQPSAKGESPMPAPLP